MLYWYGSHKIYDVGVDKDLGDIYEMTIGDYICNRFGIFQASIDPNAL